MQRDWRLDVLRGMALVFVVVNHAIIDSPLKYLTQNRLGFVTGAEVFVLVSGVLLGMIHRPRVEFDGWKISAIALWKRSWKIYYATVAVGIIVYFLSFLPVLRTQVATTDVTRGGLDVYAHDGALDLVLGLLALNDGPWQINVLGLYVQLLLCAPLFIWLLTRTRGVWMLMALSAAAWGSAQLGLTLPLPNQSSDPFPFLAWQSLFVLGLVAGWHRTLIRGFFKNRRWSFMACALGVAAFSLYRMTVDSSSEPLFDRNTMEVGRLLNVLVAVSALYGILGLLGARLQRGVRWLLAGMGASSLYVFLVHVFVLILMAAGLHVIGTDSSSVVNTVALLVVLAVIWLMVRYRVLFGVVPR